MKRIKSIQTILLAMMLLFVACERTSIDDNLQREEGLQSLTIPSLSKDTKVSATITGNTIKGAWEVGDKLLIYGGNLDDSDEAIFAIKKASDIATDGTAIFTAENSSTPYVDPESLEDVTVTHKSGILPIENDYKITIKSDASHIPFYLYYTGTLSNLLTSGGFVHSYAYLKIDATFPSVPTSPKMHVQLWSEDYYHYNYYLDLSDVISNSQLSYPCFFGMDNIYSTDKFNEIMVTMLDGATEISSIRQAIDINAIKEGKLFNFIPQTTCSVTFDKNGGEGTMTAQTVEDGVATSLNTNTFTRTNFAFREWNTKADGSGTSYANKAKVTISEDLTLYAQWNVDEDLFVGYWEASALNGTYNKTPLTLYTLKLFGIDPVAFQLNEDKTGSSPFTTGVATWSVSGDELTIDASGIAATLTVDAISATKMTLSSSSITLGTLGTATDVTITLVKKTPPVTTVNVTSVSLNKSNLTLVEGKIEALVATVNPTNATNKNVTWKSSKTSVATVDANGKVKAVSVGSATITVTTADGSKIATCTVTVVAPTGINPPNIGSGGDL